jgi:hypothetical protein
MKTILDGSATSSLCLWMCHSAEQSNPSRLELAANSGYLCMGHFFAEYVL